MKFSIAVCDNATGTVLNVTTVEAESWEAAVIDAADSLRYGVGW